MLDATRAFWYKTHLYLSILCGREAQTLKSLTWKCFRYTPSLSGYEFCALESTIKDCLCRPTAVMRDDLWTVGRPTAMSIDYWWTSQIRRSLFHDLGFVRARDLACNNLGSTVKEVLGTLITRMIHDPDFSSFCDKYCNCNRVIDWDTAVFRAARRVLQLQPEGTAVFSAIDWDTEAFHAATQPAEQPCQC